MQEAPETLEQYAERSAQFHKELHDRAVEEYFRLQRGPRRQRRAQDAINRKLKKQVTA